MFTCQRERQLSVHGERTTTAGSRLRKMMLITQSLFFAQMLVLRMWKKTLYQTRKILHSEFRKSIWLKTDYTNADIYVDTHTCMHTCRKFSFCWLCIFKWKAFCHLQNQSAFYQSLYLIIFGITMHLVFLINKWDLYGEGNMFRLHWLDLLYHRAFLHVFKFVV